MRSNPLLFVKKVLKNMTTAPEVLKQINSLKKREVAIESEFKLIQEKKSRLSAADRRAIFIYKNFVKEAPKESE